NRVTSLELGAAPEAGVCPGSGHLSSATVWAEGALRPSVLPSGAAADSRRYHPGRGDPEDSPPSEARGRPAADCPCPRSPSKIRLGCLSLAVVRRLVGDVRSAEVSLIPLSV